MRKIIFLIYLALLHWTCNFNETPFEKLSSSFFYKIHRNKPSHFAENNSVIITNVTIYNEKLSIIKHTEWETFILSSPLPPYFKQLLLMSAEGDSIFILCKREDLPSYLLPMELNTTPTHKISLALKILKIVKENDYTQSLIKNNLKENEQALIDYILKKEAKNKEEAIKNDIYILDIKQGKGLMVKPPYLVELHYRGQLPNGFVFDNSWDNKAPFYWQAGTPDQLLPGIEKALYMLRQGGYAKVLIPSHLAFGPHGSSNGLVPPFMPVIYEIWVLHVIP